jgi:hypothetical protein
MLRGATITGGNVTDVDPFGSTLARAVCTSRPSRSSDTAMSPAGRPL